MVQSGRKRGKRKRNGKMEIAKPAKELIKLISVSLNVQQDVKTTYSDLFKGNGKSKEIHNCITVVNSNTRVSKKLSVKRGGSHISTAGLPQKINSVKLDSIKHSSNEQCIKMVDDWLKNFQTDVATSSADPTVETVAAASLVDAGQVFPIDAGAGPSSPVGVREEGPPSVDSSVSAPSPSSSLGNSPYYVQGASSSASQDDEPDSTMSTGNPNRPVRTPERREKQRQASSKSRKKKKAEEDELKMKADLLEVENDRLKGVIKGMEKERTRYLSGEYQVDDDDIIDPEDECMDGDAVS